MKNFRFDTIYNITQEPQKLPKYNFASGFIGKSAVLKYNQVLSKVININGKSRFDQLITFLNNDITRIIPVRHNEQCNQHISNGCFKYCYSRLK